MANARTVSTFEWTPKREKAAIALANGHTQKESADIAEVNEKTIRRWLAEPEFIEEVDRLSLMTDIAARAERLRIAKRIIRQLQDSLVPTEKDLLDWLKYAQSETDGASIGLTALITTVTGEQ